MIDASWYQPQPGMKESVSAGGIVVRFEGDRILVALVKEEDFPDFILPKGRVEPGEDNETAARREIAEEAGLANLTCVAYLGSRQRLNFFKNCWITVHYYLFTTSKRKRKPTYTKHTYRCEWFSLDDLPSFFWPEQEELVRENVARIRNLTAESENMR